MALFKKKYEKIECSNEHIFSIDYDGVIKKWKCVVLEDEVVTYEGDEEKKHLKIMNKERAPQVLQIDTVTSIYGEMIPFQLENGFPFIKLEGEWVPSDTFAVARRDAQVKMYRRNSMQQIAIGIVMLLALLIIWLVMRDVGDLWILSVFGIFFISSGMYTMVRVRNELMAYKEAEEEAAREAAREDVDGIAAARALRSGEEE